MSKKARNVVYVLNDEVPTDEAKDPIQERLDDVMRRQEASDQEFFPLEVVLIVCCALPATLLLLFGSLEATGVLTNGGIVGLFASGAVLTCCTVYCGGICYAAKSSNDRDFEQQLKEIQASRTQTQQVDPELGNTTAQREAVAKDAILEEKVDSTIRIKPKATRSYDDNPPPLPTAHEFQDPLERENDGDELRLSSVVLPPPQIKAPATGSKSSAITLKGRSSSSQNYPS